MVTSVPDLNWCIARVAGAVLLIGGMAGALSAPARAQTEEPVITVPLGPRPAGTAPVPPGAIRVLPEEVPAEARMIGEPLEAVSAPWTGGTMAPGAALLKVQAARRALELGLPTVAADLLREVLQRGGVAAAEVPALQLDLATALLETADYRGAQTVLEGYAGVRGAAYQLRSGLLALLTRRTEEARGAAAAMRAEELPAGDRAWWLFFQGLLADASGDITRSVEFYNQAEGAAASGLARTRFRLGRMRADLLLRSVTEEQLAAYRRNFEEFLGSSLGYRATQYYAVGLVQLGRPAEAVAILQRALLTVPSAERDAGDSFRLLLGVIDGADGGVGRPALRQLVDRGFDDQKQRVALALLAGASRSGPAEAELKRWLDGWAQAQPAHPLRADVLWVRADFALRAGDYARAEQDAAELLQQFPGSDLKAAALGLQTAAAWERRRYRTAADFATQARAALAMQPGTEAEQARYGVVVAEAYFRAGESAGPTAGAGDYRNAAEAYAAVVQERPAGVELGSLMFQRVLAEVRAGRLEAAALAIDEQAKDPAFDLVSRWQAEWNFARALLAGGRPRVALGRVTRLLAGEGTASTNGVSLAGAAGETAPGAGPEDPGAPAGIPPELAAQLAWLQARLAQESGDFATAARLASALRSRLEGPGGEALPMTLRAELVSGAALLSAEALLRLERVPEGLQALQALRAAFPRADAAVFSYIAEANHYASTGRLVEAQRLLTQLADEFRGNAWAPYALFQAALHAEAREQQTYLRDAYRLLERLVVEYPRSDLVFHGRLKQGDLLRRLSDFGGAQQIYELLANTFRSHPDVLAAELALADTHAAQAASEPSHGEMAASIYERLQDLPSAPVDLRAEAAFKLGNALAHRGQTERARAVWWLAVEQNLGSDQAVAQLGVRGRYWLSRAIFEMAAVLEKAERRDEARAAYELLLRRGLGWEGLARGKLAALAGGQ